jgi:hypothetical protein
MDAPSIPEVRVAIEQARSPLGVPPTSNRGRGLRVRTCNRGQDNTEHSVFETTDSGSVF